MSEQHQDADARTVAQIAATLYAAGLQRRIAEARDPLHHWIGAPDDFLREAAGLLEAARGAVLPRGADPLVKYYQRLREADTGDHAASEALEAERFIESLEKDGEFDAPSMPEPPAPDGEADPNDEPWRGDAPRPPRPTEG